MSLGRALRESQELTNKINDLVSLVQSESVKITETKKGQSSEIMDEAIKKLGEIRGRPLFYPYMGSGVGSGPFVELEDGSVKIDLINGIGIHIMGHSHPEVIKASVRGALSDVVMQGNLEMNIEQVRLSEKLVELSKRNSKLNHVWITTSGSMANENGLKMARQKNTPAKYIISMKDAFAGRTTMMAEVTDNPNYKVGLPSYNEVLRIPFYNPNDPKSIETSLKEFRKHVSEKKGQIAAFIFEPMLGEGGYTVAPREFFIPLLEECKKEGIAVFADEIQTFSRTGEFFAYETLGFGDYVDICTIAKTAQVGATFYTDEYNPKSGLIAGTFSSSSAAISAGYEILNILDTQGYMGESGKIQKIHNEFVNMLNELNQNECKGLLTDAGGLGLMVAVTPLGGDRDKVVQLLKTLYEKGVICFGCGKTPFRLRFLIPVTITSDAIEMTKNILKEAILETK